MAGFVHFLRCVGRAAVKNGGKALCSLVPGGEAAFEMVKDVFEECACLVWPQREAVE
jgi:hypothetical protein